jgi:hypothetical protein
MKNAPCNTVQTIPGPASMKFRPNAMNSSDQSLNHLFTQFRVYSLLLRHMFIMNDTFGIKMQPKLFSSAIFVFSFSELSVSLDSTKLHCDVLLQDYTQTFIASYSSV